ncbi:hypothetical protein LZ318_15805 [Saccharopolyspora indica]|uniref:hypothetical protein n=1 Tax=Saccharopolyspora indica TaxID=1229659 RepID=UPI0022EA6B16|nr:hypothetical protein [Saccharopolyspora indica]MDA3645949.1 hypothetical protein [Saccharopolyspora indica]
MLELMPQIGYISAILACYLVLTWRPHRAQHAGGGEGALTVWQLIAHVEAERKQRERGGRHRLREPESTSDESGPPLALQQRVLDGLRNL